MMSDKWTPQLSAYLDGELGVAERAELERHLESCDECRADLQQLRGVVDWAAGYEGRAPANDVWPQISAAIGDTPSGVVQLATRRRAASRLIFSVPQSLAAAVALAVVGAGGWWLARATAPENPMASVIDISARDAGATVTATVAVAQKYGPAISDLERVLLEEEGILDSTTVRILRQQLAIIDRALTEAQEALARDPASDFLADHYTGMMKKKLSVLRAAAWKVEVSS
ncbi:MAG: zf-HC2 domain-containing protein [Gemmatimonadota bacterium]|nr:MAG: zf-HC2 domain-containing protein [Gemmatimonadota bacterium]